MKVLLSDITYDEIWNDYIAQFADLRQSAALILHFILGRNPLRFLRLFDTRTKKIYIWALLKPRVNFSTSVPLPGATCVSYRLKINFTVFYLIF